MPPIISKIILLIEGYLHISTFYSERGPPAVWIDDHRCEVRQGKDPYMRGPPMKGTDGGMQATGVGWYV